MDTSSASVAASGEKPMMFTFGRFVLDPERAVLSADGVDVPLRPKSFDVLHYLIDHAGRLVTRQELLHALWPGLIVTDDSLTQCLTDIRRALGDGSHDIIRTVPRKGYVFELSVETDSGNSSVPGSLEGGKPGASIRRTIGRQISIAALILAALTGWWLIQPPGAASKQAPHSPPPSATPAVFQPPPFSVAVLPFLDLSPAGDHEYLADGISEEILNALTRLPQLTVVARTSSFVFRGDSFTLGEISRRLNVAQVVEGSVRIEGNMARVTAQLVATQTEAHLWSQSFDLSLDSGFVLQDQVADEVARALARQLGLTVPPKITDMSLVDTNPDAWDHLLRGRFFYGRRADGDLQRALREFDEAIAVDENLAEAWAGRASTLGLLAEYGVADYRRGDRAILEALQRAVALDETNPDALIRMATWEASAGRTEEFWQYLDRAIRFGHNSALVQSMLAGWALLASDADRALALQRRAVDLDPLGVINWGNLTHYLCYARRFEEAEFAARRTVELRLDDGATATLAKIALVRGDTAAAEELAEKLPDGPERAFVLAVTHFRMGNRHASEQMVERLQANGDPRTLQLLAMARAERGETDAAFEALAAATEAILNSQDAASIEWHLLEEVRSSPHMDTLHADPRWSAWLDEYPRRLIAAKGWDASELFRRHPQLGKS